MNDGVTELLLRYGLDDLPPRVMARLDELFTADPPTIMNSLERAAAYLTITNITRRTLERVDALLAERFARAFAHVLEPQHAGRPLPPNLPAVGRR